MKKEKIETRPQVLHEATLRRVHRRLAASGALTVPAAPSMRDTYVELLATQFRLTGRPLSKVELEHLRRLLADKIDESWRRSPHGQIHIEWKTDAPPKVSLSYTVWARSSTTEQQYEEWTRTREPPLFGANPDAKVMDVARSLGPPGDVACLDVGAGTGRNTLPLARLGHPTDAVEMAPALLEILRADIDRERLPIGVIDGDVLTAKLTPGKYRFLFLCEVIAHFRQPAQLRLLFEQATRALSPGGMLLFSAFIAHESYTPNLTIQELSEVFWSTVYTRRTIAEGMAGLPFEKVSDEAVYDYEKAHLPPEAWPPTGWFADWAQGHDIFDLTENKSPIDLRWLLYRKT